MEGGKINHVLEEAQPSLSEECHINRMPNDVPTKISDVMLEEAKFSIPSIPNGFQNKINPQSEKPQPSINSVPSGFSSLAQPSFQTVSNGFVINSSHFSQSAQPLFHRVSNGFQNNISTFSESAQPSFQKVSNDFQTTNSIFSKSIQPNFQRVSNNFQTTSSIYSESARVSNGFQTTSIFSGSAQPSFQRVSNNFQTVSSFFSESAKPSFQRVSNGFENNISTSSESAQPSFQRVSNGFQNNISTFSESARPNFQIVSNVVQSKINPSSEEAQPSIYRVPNDIRKFKKEDGYTPNVVKIDPSQHRNQNLLEMVDQKRLYCRQFIEKSETKNLESIVSFLQELESKMEGGNPNDFLIDIKEILVGAKPLLTDACCIYKVPHEVRNLKEDAYTPKAVSIGPFHHGNQNLLHMEEHKRLYCWRFIQRSETKNLESFVSCVQELEPNVRGCYSHDIKLSKEEHVKVILVDCCFILEFLLEIFFTGTRGDPLFLPQRLVNMICNDLFLLENQVPFFVLEKLYNLAFPFTLSSGTSNPTHPSLLLLALLILPETIATGDNVEQYLSNVGGVAHFTDLYRKLLLRSSQFFQPSQCSREGKVTHLYSATELNELGVKFKVNENSKCILDLELSGHTLRIPFIKVEDRTEVVFRNLLAFEQCHCIHESYLADYIQFLDFLIDTDKDVDFLIKEGIIQNWLGDSNTVAKMFNNLAVHVVTPDFNEKYSLIFESLNAFCARPLNQKIATLKRDYCNTAWQAAASIAAIFLLFLTVLQTVISVLQEVN